MSIRTDISGSIRVPPANNEIKGFKPTTCRISLQDVVACQMRRGSIIAIAGLLAR